MPTSYSSTRKLPFLADLSARDREMAEKALTQQEGRRRKAADARAREADAIIDEARGQLRDLIGAQKLAELRDAMRRERLRFRDLWQPPVDSDLDRGKETKARKRRLDALVRKLGASPERLREIGTSAGDRLRDLLSAVDGRVSPGYGMQKHLDRWLDLSPLHRHPLPWGVLPPLDDPNDPHRWFLFRPPFWGFLFHFTPVASSCFVVERLLFLDPPAGLVGYEVTMDCNDADDYDYASGDAQAQIAVAFEAPTAGVVEVLIDAQSTIGTHHAALEDEWGWSEGWAAQHNYLTMSVLHPNVPEPSQALMSDFVLKFDGDDVTRDRENLVRGQHYYAQLFSAGPVPGGQTVIITAGTRTFDIAAANDIEVHSRSNFQWFINSVEVRISP